MSNEVHWISTRITEARNRYPIVTEAVSVRTAELLKEQLTERQLSAKELTSVAKALIADMVPIPAKAEAKQ
jgi:hypothetical protein